MEKYRKEMFRRTMIECFKREFNIKKDEDIGFVEEMTDMVLNEFNGEDTIDDDYVNPEIRDVLYLLEAMDFLKMDITEKHIVDGRVWRRHFWVLNHYQVEKMQKQKKEVFGKDPHPKDIYNEIPEQVWRSRKTLTDLRPSAPLLPPGPVGLTRLLTQMDDDRFRDGNDQTGFPHRKN
jgi:hypothetical protein